MSAYRVPTYCTAVRPGYAGSLTALCNPRSNSASAHYAFSFPTTWSAGIESSWIVHDLEHSSKEFARGTNAKRRLQTRMSPYLCISCKTAKKSRLTYLF